MPSVGPEAPLPRVISAGEELDTTLFTMAHSITSTPAPISEVDSFGVIPGLGEDIRVTTAVRAWEANPRARHLLVAGTNPTERVQIPLSLDALQAPPFNLRRTRDVVTQVETENTRTQALWLLDSAYDLGVDSMALFVSHWHMPRAYSTVVKAMLEKRTARDLLPIFPVPVGTAPNAVVPEVGETVSDLSAGEAVRIKRYQGIGHVATLPELREYLNWLWTQDIVPIK